MEMRRCSQCSYEFERQFEINHHVQRTHRSATEPLFDSLATPEQFQCIYCAFKSFYTLDLYEHYKQKQHFDQIDDKFVQSYKLSLLRPFQIQLKFSTSETPARGYKTKKRLSVHQVFAQQSRYLKRHMLTHASHDEITWYPCNKCSYKTNRKCNLTRHVLKHAATGANLFQCPKCACKIKHESSLKAHILLQHTSTEWFQCSTCSYRTRRKASLKAHASAEQIDWFPCTECSHKSKRKRDLKTHMLKHGSPEWFQCVECSFRTERKFNFKNHMLKHATSHDDNVWFQCANCSYETIHKGSLTSHMLKHASADEIDWFPCTKCSHKSKRKRDLKTHMLKHAAQ